MATALRPLSTGELLDRTFFLYRNRFGLFIGIFALPHLAAFAYQCLGLAFQSPGRPQLVNALMSIVWGLGAILVALVVSAASQAATVVAVSQVHLDRPASVMEAFSRVKRQILPVIGLSLLVGLLVGLACIALIVPGVILMLMWSLAVPVKVLENKGVTESMSRSSELTQGHRGRIFVIWILFFVLSVGISMLLQFPIEFAAGVSTRGAIQRAGIGWQVASLVATFVSECLVGPLATIAFSLVYYDERVRKEAFDLQLMMTTLDGTTLPGAPIQAGA